MSEGLEKLRALGEQKLYEDTHIPLQQIRAILEENFDNFHKVQLSGFFSILEREYSVELTSSRAVATERFLQQAADKVDKGIFVTPENENKNGKSLYIAVIIVLFIGVLLYNMSFSDSGDEDTEHLNDTLIENIGHDIEPAESRRVEENLTNESDVVEDINSTMKENEEDISESEVEVTTQQAVEESFKIFAKSKVWSGYIDTKENKKYQKTFKGELDLDPQKSWLLVFGHPYINIYIDGEKTEFKSKKSKRFFYNNGTVRNISAKEFKRLNRGRKW